MSKKETKRKIERMIKLEIRDLDKVPTMDTEELNELTQQQLKWYKVLETLKEV